MKTTSHQSLLIHTVLLSENFLLMEQIWVLHLQAKLTFYNYFGVKGDCIGCCSSWSDCPQGWRETFTVLNKVCIESQNLHDLFYCYTKNGNHFN